MRLPSRLRCLIGLVVLQSCRSVDEDPQGVAAAIREVGAFADGPKAVGDPLRDAYERQEWEQQIVGYSSYVAHVRPTTTLLDPMPGEVALQKNGTRGISSIKEFLDRPQLWPVITARLLVILGSTKDRSLIPLLSSYLGTSQPVEVRRAAIRALVLIGGEQVSTIALSCLKGDALPKQDILWALFRTGHPEAEEEYHSVLHHLLDSHLQASFPVSPSISRPSTGTKKDENPDKQRLPRKLWDPAEIARDLVNLADSHSVKGIGLLIECLRLEDMDLQHLIEDLLNRTIKDPEEIVKHDITPNSCESLHNGGHYRLWKAWYGKHRATLSWNEEMGRFIVL